MLLNSLMPEVTVCNTVSLLLHVTVLFTPMITTATSGEYPAEDIFEPAPLTMATFTLVIETDRLDFVVIFVVLVELVLVVLVLIALVDPAEVVVCETDWSDVVLSEVVTDVLVEV